MNWRRWVLHTGLFISLALLLTGAAQERLWLYGSGSYAPGEEVRLEYYGSSPRPMSLTLYRVGNPETLLTWGGPQHFQGTSELALSQIRTLTVAPQGASWGTINLGRLASGVYFAQLEGDSAKGATLMLVTDLSLVVKSDQDTVLTYTAQSSSGEPRRSLVYLLQGENLHAEGLADDEGLTRFSTTTNRDELVVAAKYGDAWAFSSSYWQRWGLERHKLYLHTDRPVYRPGHTVHYKGTARSPGGLEPLAGENVQLIIRDADNTEIQRQELTTDAYGSFHGEVHVRRHAPLGSYLIEANLRGERYYHDFLVEEYQKPEYRVSVTPDTPVAVQGDTARVVIAAEYLFGGPVAGGTVNYAVLQQPYYRFRYRSSFGFYEDFDYSYSYGGAMTLRGEGVLDEAGELVLEFPLGHDPEDYRLLVQAGVSDAARREIDASGSLLVYRAGVVLDVRTERYAVEVGDEVTVNVRAEDLGGNPVSVPFTLASERYYWLRGEGSQRSAGPSVSGQTDADGNATVTLSFNQQGSYTLQLSAADEAGRITSAQRSLWVSDDSPWFWAFDGLSIRADKEEYALGDRARFVIQSPVQDGYALITREGQRLASYELVPFAGSVLTYELDITEAMTPNSYLSVVIVGNNRTYFETVGFRVPPVNQFLNVEMSSDSDRYQPGNEGHFRVRVSDVNGRGVQAQLSLGLVDEAIYLVRPERTPDIRGFFYALQENVVGTQLSSWYYFGQAEPLPAPMAARDAMDEAIFAQAKAGFAEAEVREDFRDTILWLPTIETDANGLADVEVTFPDNLTEWRLTARGITLAGEVGQNTYSVTTTLPVIARLASPRYLVRGDEASLRVIAQSNLEEAHTGRLELLSEGLTTLAGDPQELLLSAGGQASSDFRVQAERAGTAHLTASALTPVFSDAMRVPLPVLPHGVREEIGWAGSGDSRWRFEVPASADPNFTEGTLYLTPSLAAAVSPALAYLAGFPYGCTEQTMSRFLPSVLAAQAGDLAQLPEAVAAELDEMVEAGLRRIYDFQHDSGGWGFWQHDASSPFISAYVVVGLLEAQQAGYPVRERVLEWALGYLERVVRNETQAGHRLVDADGKAYAYYALARAGRDVEGLAGLVGAADMSPYGLALSVLAFHQVGRDVEANVYLDALIERVNERAQVAYWDTGAPRFFWNDDRVETTAYALEALARLRPDEPLIAKVVNWLLLERQGARWVSTKDTAAVVKAALVLAEVSGEAEAEYQVDVTLNGQLVASLARRAQSHQSIDIPLTDLRAGSNQLELNVSGSGALYASAEVSYVAEQEFLEPDAQGITISRSYETLVPSIDEETGQYGYDRIPLNAAHRVGDYVLVTVTLTPDEAQRYVLVNEPVPAGYRVIENDQAFRVAGVETPHGWDYFGWNYWYDGRDIRDERVDYYFTYLQGEVSFTYILRAETPGVYTALPTQAWLMYEPDVKGLGARTVLAIVDDD